MNSNSIFAAFILILFFTGFYRLVRGRVSPKNPKDFRYLSKLPSESRSAFFLCSFSLLGKLAAIDGFVDPGEEQRVTKYIQEELLLPDNLQTLALKIFNEALDSPLDYREYVAEFKRAFPDRVKLQGSLLQLLLEVSAADGVLGRREDEFIRSVALLLDFSEPHYEKLKEGFESYH